MAWDARQLFLHPHPDTIAALRAIPSLEGHLYHIPHLRDFAATSEEPFAVVFPLDGGPAEPVSRTVTRLPTFPPGGLLVVKEFGDPEDSRTHESCINWNCFDFTAMDVPSPIESPAPEQCFPDANDWRTCHNPPDALRRVAATLAHRTRTAAAYVSIETWGGDLEYALAWTFDGRSRRAAFLRHEPAADDPSNADHPPLPGVVEVTPTHTRFIAAGDVLTLALLPFDVLLRDGSFEPHTRSFPWTRYRLGK